MRVKMSGDVLSTQSAGVAILPGRTSHELARDADDPALVAEREVVADRRLHAAGDEARLELAEHALERGLRRSGAGKRFATCREVEHLASPEREHGLARQARHEARGVGRRQALRTSRRSSAASSTGPMRAVDDRAA